MSRNIRVSEPSAEMQIKIIRAKDAIASQKPRTVRCPYCRHNSIIVFEDTRRPNARPADARPSSMYWR